MNNERVEAALHWPDVTGGQELQKYPVRWVALGPDGPVRTRDETVADEDPERVVSMLNEADVSIEDVFLVFFHTVFAEG